MNNSTIKLLLNRKSVRAYEPRVIADADKNLILQAALRAPTAGNMLLYTIIEVTDQAIKDQLAVTCDDQPFIARAPLVLLFAADYQRWYDYYLFSGVEQICQEQHVNIRTPQEGDLLLACCDTLIAAQTAVTAAEALGIGSCYIGDILERYEIHRDLFHLPRYVLPLALVCFGYPTPEQSSRKQPERFGSEFIIHQNTYQRLDQNALERMFQPRNNQLLAHGPRQDSIQNVGQFNYLKKFSAEFTTEMTRSVKVMLENWSDHNPEQNQ
jgi:FMN reductase (NADPH)/FMN reductase [NAD(P)H]